MAGYSRIYCIGGEGGFMGSDGVNPIDVQIWQGEGNRQWLEVHYFRSDIRPLGRITRIVPVGPSDHDAVLDATIAFLPDLYQDCPSFKDVAATLPSDDMLDFTDAKSVPAAWPRLREEARERFANLIVYEADLVPLKR